MLVRNLMKSPVVLVGPEESLAGFVSWLLERGDSSAREAEAALHTAGEDVVTLTTVHGAKGLEWPVVFLVDLDRGMAGASRTPDLFLDAEDGIGIRLVRDDVAKEERECGAWECLRDRASKLPGKDLTERSTAMTWRSSSATSRRSARMPCSYR